MKSKRARRATNAAKQAGSTCALCQKRLARHERGQALCASCRDSIGPGKVRLAT